MKRSTLALLGLLFASPAFATTYDDVVALLAAQTAEGEVVTAVQSSAATFFPRHVYALIDQEAPPAVIKAVAAKAAVFYDPSMQSLDQQSAPARAAAPATALTVAAGQDFAAVLAHYAALKTELDAAKAKVPPPAPRTDGETEAAYDKRVRAHQEEVARALAFVEGKIQNTKVTVELPATYEPYDTATKCFPKVHLQVDLSAVPFESWRWGMGGMKSPLPVTVGKESKTVDMIQFASDGTKRSFEARSKPVCVYPDEASGFASRGAKLVMEMSRTHRGEDWTATAKFVDAKTGDTLHVKSK